MKSTAALQYAFQNKWKGIKKMDKKDFSNLGVSLMIHYDNRGHRVATMIPLNVATV